MHCNLKGHLNTQRMEFYFILKKVTLINVNTLKQESKQQQKTTIKL